MCAHSGGMVRSLHLNTEVGFRGGEVQTLGLARHLADLDQEVVLLAPPGSELLRRASGAGLDTVAFEARGEWDIFGAWRLRRILRRRAPHILHAHTPHALALALLARGRATRPLIVASRRVSFPFRSTFSLRKWARADALVAVSRSIGDTLSESGIPPERVHIIHSGVDLSRFSERPSSSAAKLRWKVPPDAPTVGVISALSHHKGVGTFMTALHQVWTQVPAVQALVAGEGELLGPLSRAAAIQNLPVRFLGFLPEPAELMPALDVLALPSLSGEGSPGAVKEAAAAGVPVVATDVGGTTEILRPEEEALIVPPRDPNSLAQAVVRLFSDPDLARRLRDAALLRIRGFGMDTMAASTLALYREILDGKRGRG